MKIFTTIICTLMSLIGLAQFNNIYFYDLNYRGASLGIKENPNTGDCYISVSYLPDGDTENSLGFLNLSPEGQVNEIKHLLDLPETGSGLARQGYFKTVNNDYILSGSHFATGPFVYRLDDNLDTIYTVSETGLPDHNCWGGVELFNGDLIFGIVLGSSSTDTLKIRRYSESLDFLQAFDIAFDYNFLIPNSFIAKDSLIYISLHHLLPGSHRRNLIVCCNALTGEEIWETHQLEDENELGYIDGHLCVTSDGTLKHVFFKQVELAFPGNPTASSYVYLTVVDVDYETGALTNEAIISNLEYASYVADVAATNDGGFVVLTKSYDQSLDETSFWTISKISEAMEVEWRHQYFQPIEFIGGNGSYLYDIDTTSDDGIIAAGTAWGVTIESEYYEQPWVLKIDACGNEIITDCSLSGLGELSGRNKISIYPNPARDRIFLKAENAIQHAMIFDMNGKMVHNEIFSGAQEQTLFIDHLPPGLYLVNAIDSKGVRSSARVVVEK